MVRRRLSTVAEEDAFLAADEACDACAAGLKPLILARFRAQGAALDRTMLGMAVVYRSPSAMHLTFSPRVVAHDWTEAHYPEAPTVAKARKGTTEAELLSAAVDAGLELGLQTLPAAARREVDVNAARRAALAELKRGQFRRNLADLEESQRALARLAGAANDPSLATLADPDKLASMFGITDQQAKTLARETKALMESPYGKRKDAVRRAMTKRVRQALEFRAELLSQQLGSEAIQVAQDALYAQARKQGLLDADRYVQEWVTRRDAKVCPVCDAFDGERAEIGEVFESTEGEESYGPPQHPRCRCRKRLVKVANPRRGRRAA